jgi:undecaprenyl-diphosphatase
MPTPTEQRPHADADARPRPSWSARRLDPDRSLGLRLTVAAVAAFLVLVPFSLLALLVLGSWTPLHRLDEQVTVTLHAYAVGHPGWVDLMTAWSAVFAPWPLRMGALALVIWLARRGARRLALWVITTMVTGGLLGVGLKLLVGRDRPDLLDPVTRAAGYSFPSGHALNAALAAGVLLLVVLPMARSPWARGTVWAAAATVAVVTGLSRVAIGVHYSSDVLGGWLLGAAVVAATAAGFTAWRHRQHLPPTDRPGPPGTTPGPDHDSL